MKPTKAKRAQVAALHFSKVLSFQLLLNIIIMATIEAYNPAQHLSNGRRSVDPDVIRRVHRRPAKGEKPYIPEKVGILYCVDAPDGDTAGMSISATNHQSPRVGTRAVTVAYNLVDDGRGGVIYGAAVFHRRQKKDAMNRVAHRATAISRLLLRPVFVPENLFEVTGAPSPPSSPPDSAREKKRLSMSGLRKYLRKCVHQYGVGSH